ncbi:MAG: dTDP-4-dehydrorhamnose reductase [Bacteroidales bacterium]|jgi:dTDP-4-dehydrorhamnose reductase|nr:dTDP-4-dehydrorhamnose reductase [Bacteroidales bacterium]
MKTILVTGANGQLGSELQEHARNYSHFNFIFTDYGELDITDETAVGSFFSSHTLDYVINCAAYTSVDKAETDYERAKILNAEAVGILAKEAHRTDIPFIHISTDYVFDGKNFKPYQEDDVVNPQSAYGKTKLDGENLAFANHEKTMIIRTSWLYSSFGNNFVKTMIRLGKEREELSVIFDQIGTPTYAHDLADGIISMIDSVEKNEQSFTSGIYHYSNEGVCSWFDFAKEIHAYCNIPCTVNPIKTKDYPTPAQRPFYSVLDKSKIKETYSLSIPYWKDSLHACIEKIK